MKALLIAKAGKDNHNVAHALGNELKNAGLSFRHAQDMEGTRQIIKTYRPDFVVVDGRSVDHDFSTVKDVTGGLPMIALLCPKTPEVDSALAHKSFMRPFARNAIHKAALEIAALLKTERNPRLEFNGLVWHGDNVSYEGENLKLAFEEPAMVRTLIAQEIDLAKGADNRPLVERFNAILGNPYDMPNLAHNAFSNFVRRLERDLSAGTQGKVTLDYRYKDTQLEHCRLKFG